MTILIFWSFKNANHTCMSEQHRTRHSDTNNKQMHSHRNGNRKLYGYSFIHQWAGNPQIVN